MRVKSSLHAETEKTTRTTPPPLAIVPTFRPMKSGKTILDVRQLRLQRGGHLILDSLCWRVARGQHWVILGPNGSGKTSLLAALTGYLAPTAGEIKLLGETFGESDWRELRRRIGIVSSTVHALIAGDEPAVETVASGKSGMIDLWHRPSRIDAKRALSILRNIECAALAHRPWYNLSQGERQRILIGRALMADPDLLILDEPCAGLDPVAREHFLQFIQRLGQSRRAPAIVLVTHHVEEITPIFTHALLLRDGRCTHQGRLKEVLNSRALSESFACAIKLEKRGNRYALKVRPKRRAVL